MNPRQKNSYLFALLMSVAVLLLSVSMLPVAQGFDDDDDSDDRGNGAFGRRLAGAYLVDRGPAGRGLLNIMADGNIFSEETNDFGDGVPAAFQSGSRGSWERTGRREIKYTFFVFGYDVNGINTTTVVVLNTAIIDKSFDRWDVTGGFEVFTADQDPLDPNEVPFFASEVPPFSARRIPVGR